MGCLQPDLCTHGDDGRAVVGDRSGAVDPRRAVAGRRIGARARAAGGDGDAVAGRGAGRCCAGAEAVHGDDDSRRARLLERSIYETGAVSGRSGTVLLGPLPVLRFDGAGGDGVVSALARAGARELKRGWDIGRRCCREHQYSGAEQPAGVTLRILTPQDYYPATRDLEESRMQSHFQKTKVYQEPRRSALLFSAA
jgi:hypothetical protein